MSERLETDELALLKRRSTFHRLHQRHRWGGSQFATRLSFGGGSEAQHQLKWLFGDEGRTVAQCESSGCAERTSWFKPWIPRWEMNAGLAPRPFGRRLDLKGRGDAYAIETPA